ncbi:hypothetical protein GCM10022381_01800 [Leifsonia kafniensis]|uniref:Anti-sigma factor n=1 Tax=Leifsonia kafniensis TaxID=475957 RepID=A0ABP7JZY4_9MICO
MGTIDDYLASLDPADRDVIARLYAIAREEVPEPVDAVRPLVAARKAQIDL